METYKVYAQVDESGCILAIGSSAFITDTEHWLLIDAGTGDRYHHAQGNYLARPLTNEHGVPQYKLVDGRIVARTVEEISADCPPSAEIPSLEERLTALETAGQEHAHALTELKAMLTKLTSGLL